MEYWTTDGLSTVASGVGKPLYPDAITRACTRLDFARVCVMIDVAHKLTKHIIVMMPDESEGETTCKVDVEYEWLPPKCTNCMNLGHMTKDCPLNKTHKPSKPPVAVYVAKINIPPPQPNNEKSRKSMRPAMIDKLRREEGEVIRERNTAKNDDRDVHVLDLGEQFVHCRITSRAVNESVLVTVVYGASEVIDRRILWTALETLAQQYSDAPWLLGGDFNAVRDLNEVCGISGDIRMATEEFNTGILEASLIPLPMQGEWFTWHNCNTSAWSLCRRLDRILINDRWLERFPAFSYHSLTPRTSDHSPLVLYGDTQQHNGGMFQFDNYLAHSPEFIPNVQNIWHHEVVGIPMYAMTRKMKALKPIFRLQRRNKGDLMMNVQLAKGFLDEAQLLVSSDRQNELFLLLEHCCRIVYAKAAKLEQIMLQERAKMAAANVSVAAGSPCAFFRRVGERPVTFSATGVAAGADVAAEVNDKVGEVDERADDISPTRADVMHDARADVIPVARADVIHDARADVIHPRANITYPMEKKIGNLGKESTPVPLFIGNIPLHTGSNGMVNDKIADAFNNSSRKTLSFIAPTKQNGEVVVRPSLDTMRDGAKRWKSTAVGYFMGKRPYYHHLKEFAHSIWPALREVTATANGFFFFRFKTEIDMEEVIEGGPWLFQGQPIVLQKWEPGMAMRKMKHTQVPVWIKLRHLPLEFWTTEGLSTVASGVDEDGGETPCKVDIEYEWLPPKCTECMMLGHSVKECSLINPQKQTKPPVKVYVPKANVPPPPTTEERVKKHKTVVVVDDKVKGDEGSKQNKRYTLSQKEKGKEVVTFNPFDALNSLDDAEENNRGPNTCSPSSSDPC
ncbi:UNVERIFIED_CONTAM: hypothetical protein Sindi_2654600 [Sesamum indicum]